MIVLGFDIFAPLLTTLAFRRWIATPRARNDGVGHWRAIQVRLRARDFEWIVACASSMTWAWWEAMG